MEDRTRLQRIDQPVPGGQSSKDRAAPEVRLESSAGRWLVAVAVLGSSMTMFDATAVNLALPALGEDLDAGLSGLQWTVNAYILALAAFILLGGSLGDRYGRRRLFVIGAAGFGVTSLLCAVAPTIELLVVARALQGLAGALLTPGSLAIIAATFTGSDRARAVGLWSGLGGVAGAVGPFLGGALLGAFGWRSIFLVNLPAAVLIGVMAVRHVPESRDDEAPRRLDVAGAVLGAVGLGALTYGLIGAGEEGWTSVLLVAAAVGVVALAVFVVVERRSSHPMVPLDVFSSRQFTAANLVTFFVYGAFGGLFFLLVLQLQIVVGLTPLQAGLALLPITVLMLLGSAWAGTLAEQVGARLPLTAGSLVCAGGLLLMTRVGIGSSLLVDVVPAAALFGAGLTLVVAPLTATVLAAASARRAGVASGINNAVARAAGLFAVAVLPLAAGLSADDYLRPERFAAGFRAAMLICAGLLALGSVIAVVMIEGHRRTVPGPASGATTGAQPVRTRHCAVDGPPLEPPRPQTASEEAIPMGGGRRT